MDLPQPGQSGLRVFQVIQERRHGGPAPVEGLPESQVLFDLGEQLPVPPFPQRGHVEAQLLLGLLPPAFHLLRRRHWHRPVVEIGVDAAKLNPDGHQRRLRGPVVAL